MSDLNPAGGAAQPLLALLDLCHRARSAASADELAFLVVNDTRALHPYRQAALWFAEGGVRALSGVVQPESSAPYAQWLSRLCRVLSAPSETGEAAGRPRRIDRLALPAELAAQWADWLPAEAVWLPLPASEEHAGSALGGVLLAGDARFSDDALALLEEWLHAWRHAWLARVRVPFWSRGLRSQSAVGKSRPRWRRRPYQIAFVLLCALFIPVRLTVLAPGELVPADPAVIRAPLDGVIGEFHVQPNEAVTSGQLLFTFDEAALASRLDVARLALATEEAKYRQFAQLALNDQASKAQLAVLIGTINEKRAEAEFLQNQLERSRVLAPRDGIVLFDAPSEWIGRPVQTGERVMRLATPGEVEIEAWLGIGDAIPIADQAALKLYLAATPFASIAGQVRYIAHDAQPRPDGSYAYRLRATLEDNASGSIGLKGTAKLYGDWVPLGYWILRRPLATIRQFIAL